MNLQDVLKILAVINASLPATQKIVGLATADARDPDGTVNVDQVLDEAGKTFEGTLDKISEWRNR